MPITINGSGNITGLAAGWLPDATVTGSDLTVGAAVSNIGYPPARGESAVTGALSLDTVKTPGLYHYDQGFLGTKPPDNADNYRTIELGGLTRYTQLAFPWNSNRAFLRRIQDAVTYAWDELAHTGNAVLNQNNFQSTANVMRYKGIGVVPNNDYLSGLDALFGDANTGYWTINRPSFSSAVIVMNVGGSVGTIQWATNYDAAMYRRNRTDNTTWTAWRQQD